MSLIREFIAERDWEQYHRPVALAISASIEVGELLELFQWRTDVEIERDLDTDEFRSALADEIADSLVYLLRLADRTGIDPTKAIIDKMKKNAEKYPVSEWRSKAPNKTG
ncbi:MAG: nucleotide pyrophosphohydrolase [Candidatus Thorarchaeota archaeon]